MNRLLSKPVAVGYRLNCQQTLAFGKKAKGWQHFCLDQIGIDRWTLRATPFHIHIVSTDELPLTPSAKRLLLAILKTMGWTEEQVTLSQGFPEKMDSGLLWVMGEHPTHFSLYQGSTIHSPSLSKLLTNPSLKRDVFLKLQKFFQA